MTRWLDACPSARIDERVNDNAEIRNHKFEGRNTNVDGRRTRLTLLFQACERPVEFKINAEPFLTGRQVFETFSSSGFKRVGTA
jgi:NADH:ubiquinone oxidoreductase subunit